ncbi:MAG: AraC family transcriptional regulator [Bacillota bacterium]|jgi:AraC family transcriptional regulator|nr:AraC family transcriptional regulator [Bacillota bacterium]NLV62010.1 helix-turn-helix transcriptional regulator [Clostridiaceae bacterium]
MEKPNDLNQNSLNMIQMSLNNSLSKGELFYNIIDFFPYPIEVYARDGTMIMVNRAMLREFDVPGKDIVIGKYNIFKDPEMEKAGLSALVRDIFDEKTNTVTDIKVPFKSIRRSYKSGRSDIYAKYQDAITFPILDKAGGVSNVGVLFITRRVYKGNPGIARALEYLEDNWNKAYNLKEVAKAANLSPYHFSRVFKNDTGLTPYSYYMKIKLENLTKMLCDENYTIREVFNVCGMPYSGHSFSVFKKYAGVTPKQYRKKK